MNSLLEKLAAKGGGGAVFDAAAMNRAFAQTDGVRSVSLKNTGERQVGGPITLSDVGRFPLVDFENTVSGGHLNITLDRKTAAGALSLLSPDFVDYLSSLLAPIATGEELTKAEYLELVASIYGKALAGEIADARFDVTLEVPGPVTGIKGGTHDKSNKTEFKIPLIDLLTLEEPLVYEIRWGVWR
jgi:hypothetical protein